MKYLALHCRSSRFTRGCAANGQMPPAPPHGVLITITPPADGSCGTGKPACAYAIYKAVTTTGVCPASGDVSFGVLVASQTSLTYTDNASAATTTCYGAETLQSGSHSGPSNIIGPYTDRTEHHSTRRRRADCGEHPADAEADATSGRGYMRRLRRQFRPSGVHSQEQSDFENPLSLCEWASTTDPRNSAVTS